MKLPVRTADGRQTPPPPPPPPPSETRPPPKASSYPDDQAWVLREALLQLGPALRTAVRGRDRVVVKSAAQGQLLGVSREEKSILDAFGEGRKVSSVLSGLMIAGKSPPLSEFYELVIKAVDRGILVVRDVEPPPRRRPLNFRFKLPIFAAVPLILAAFGFGLFGLLAADLVKQGTYGTAFFGSFETRFLLPRGAIDYLAGLLVVFGAASLGSLAGAGVARACDAEVYGPAWTWRPPLPHIRLDLRDVRMAGRGAEMATGLARLAPALALLGVVVLWWPHLALVLLLGCLWLLLPQRRGAVAQFLSGATGRVPVDTHRELRFEGARRNWSRLSRRLSLESRAYAAALALAWLLWMTGVFFLFSQVFPAWVAEQAPALLTAPILSAVAAAAVVLPAGLAIRAGARNARDALRRSRRRREAERARDADLAAYDESHPPPAEKVAALLEESVLFGGIDSAEREALARRLEPRFVGKGEVLVDENSECNRVFLVFKGTFEVRRELASGRTLQLARLKHGDVFGTVPLWDEPPRVRIVRSLEAGIVYSLSNDEFETIGLSEKSREAVKDSVKASFLLRVPFFREWSREAVKRFAQAGSFIRCPAGRSVVQVGDPKPYFHIVYDGVCEISGPGGAGKSRLGIGDFFGVRAMLSDFPSDVTVFCREDARFLLFGRKDFLRAICEQPEAALAFEKRCSRSLGRPVFPLSVRK